MKKIIFVLIGVCLLFCGCTKPQTVSEESGGEATTISDNSAVSHAPETTATVSDEPQPYPITLNDVELMESPQRVISLSPSLTEIICEMGYSKRLVARSSYCDYPPEITALSDLGSSSDPNIDMMIELKPDVVFTSTAIASMDIFTLEKEGIQVIYVPAPKTLDNLQSVYRLIGYAFEGTFDGGGRGDEFFAPIKTAYDGIVKSDGLSFAYITENMTVATRDTLESFILSAYAENIAVNSEKYLYDKTFLTEMQPDIIFLNSIYTAEELTADEVYGTLDAVKNGKIVLVENKYFERPSARIVKLLDKINTAIGELE